MDVYVKYECRECREDHPCKCEWDEEYAPEGCLAVRVARKSSMIANWAKVEE